MLVLPAIAALIASTAAVAAQTSNCAPNFQPCIDGNVQFLQATCEPMRATNMTLYQDCHCYHFVNLALCYQLCPDDPTQQAVLAGSVKPSITAECNAANLNPNALPQPPPWQTWFAPSTTAAATTQNAAAAATSAATSSAAAAATTAAAGSRSDAVTSGISGLAAAIAGAIALFVQ